MRKRMPNSKSKLPARKVAFILASSFEDAEFKVPYEGLRAAGYAVEVIGAKAGEELKGVKGKEKVKADGPWRVAGLCGPRHSRRLLPGQTARRQPLRAIRQGLRRPRSTAGRHLPRSPAAGGRTPGAGAKADSLADGARRLAPNGSRSPRRGGGDGRELDYQPQARGRREVFGRHPSSPRAKRNCEGGNITVNRPTAVTCGRGGA